MLKNIKIFELFSHYNLFCSHHDSDVVMIRFDRYLPVMQQVFSDAYKADPPFQNKIDFCGRRSTHLAVDEAKAFLSHRGPVY